MKPRINYASVAPEALQGLFGTEKYLSKSSLGHGLLHMLKLRASQMNGCAYCIDMHWKDLRALDETELRLYSLAVWRECPWYTERERAALAWAEAVTFVATGQVPDAVHAEVRPHFSDTELADLTLAVATINAWNRLSIAARLTPGTYKPALATAAPS